MTELVEVARRIAEQAGPGEQVEAFVGHSRSVSVRAHGGEVESFTSADGFGVGIRVVRDGRSGFAFAGTLDADVLVETLADARDNATYAEADEFVGLALPDGVEPPPLSLWRDGVAACPDQRKVALALELEQAVLGRDARVTGVRVARYADVAGEAAVASSIGIARQARSTTCWLSVQALAADGAATQMGAGVHAGREPADLDVEVAATDAVERATRLIGARKPDSQRLTVVLDARMAAAVLGIVAGTLTGETVLKGRSPFADRTGDAIASAAVTLVDDPTDARSLAADPFDGEGLATRRNVLIDRGVLQGYLHDSYSGRRLGASSTGSAVRGARSTPVAGVQALAVAPGAMTIAELVAGIERGVLVTSLLGLHSGVNSVSGDFSVGVEGLMIRGGALAEPVHEATVGSTLQRLLLDVVAVGAEQEWLPGGAASVPVVVADVQLSGN